jgi:hypothetical protein
VIRKDVPTITPRTSGKPIKPGRNRFQLHVDQVIARVLLKRQSAKSASRANFEREDAEEPLDFAD